MESDCGLEPKRDLFCYGKVIIKGSKLFGWVTQLGDEVLKLLLFII